MYTSWLLFRVNWVVAEVNPEEEAVRVGVPLVVS